MARPPFPALRLPVGLCGCRVLAAAGGIVKEAQGDTVQQAVEAELEAVVARQVHAAFDVTGQFGVTIACVGGVVAQPPLPLLFGEPGALDELVPGGLAVRESEDVVVERR